MILYAIKTKSGAYLSQQGGRTTSSLSLVWTTTDKPTLSTFGFEQIVQWDIKETVIEEREG